VTLEGYERRRAVKRRTAPRPSSPLPIRRRVDGSGTDGVDTSTGPVLPVWPEKTSATKMLPRAFGTVISAIVALAIVKSTLLVMPRLPLPHVAHQIPKLKSPVPSPLRLPVFACSVCPANV